MLHSLEHFVSTLEKNTIFRVLSLLLVSFIGIYLIRSVVTSGYYYIFDNDELYHTQVTYLLSNGYKPFTDIYLTVYPPLYHWFIQPLFTIGGFSFDTIYGEDSDDWFIFTTCSITRNICLFIVWKTSGIACSCSSFTFSICSFC